LAVSEVRPGEDDDMGQQISTRAAVTCAVLAQKGGVGKTTTLLGLAGAAWERGLRTLVVDLDPQANATASLDPASTAYTTNDVLADARPGVASDAIVASGWGPGIDVLPSERALEHRAVPEGRDSTLRLRIALEGVIDNYDIVLVDCPPSLGELTRNALAAVRLALVVTEPSFFALPGAAAALEAIEVVRGSNNLVLRPAGVLVNRSRPQTSEHAFRLDELRAAYPGLVLPMTVPERTALQQAQGACVPVQAWRSPGAREVADVYEDVLDVLLDKASHTVADLGVSSSLTFSTGTDSR
jgi:cellulose biosynthesis protein BcsQ